MRGLFSVIIRRSLTDLFDFVIERLQKISNELVTTNLAYLFKSLNSMMLSEHILIIENILTESVS